MILTVVFYTFIICLAIQIIYYILFSSIFFKLKKTPKQKEITPISVIIFVKNSAAYLEENIQHFLNQEYPEFEILLVNNESYDGTEEVLEKVNAKHPSIKVIDVKNNESFWGNKKYTFTLAIKAAKYENLLFSEINTIPLSKHWISEMSEKYTNEKSIVLGYKKIKSESSFGNLIIRFDNLLSTLKAFTFCKLNSPYTASANNHAFTKKEFYKVKGFINHIKIREGKEDLFLKDASQNKNTTFSISPDSFVELKTPFSFKDWILEKRNQYILQTHYSVKNKFFIRLFLSSKIVFYILSIVLLFLYSWKIIGSILAAYFLLQYIIIGISGKKLNESKLLFFLPALEISWVLIQISIFIANLISKPNHWK